MKRAIKLIRDHKDPIFSTFGPLETQLASCFPLCLRPELEPRGTRGVMNPWGVAGLQGPPPCCLPRLTRPGKAGPLAPVASPFHSHPAQDGRAVDDPCKLWESSDPAASQNDPGGRAFRDLFSNESHVNSIESLGERRGHWCFSLNSAQESIAWSRLRATDLRALPKTALGKVLFRIIPARILGPAYFVDTSDFLYFSHWFFFDTFHFAAPFLLHSWYNLWSSCFSPKKWLKALSSMWRYTLQLGKSAGF